MYALTTAVFTRSYSRYCGDTSADCVTGTPGRASTARAATAASCSGLAYEWRNATASDSAPASRQRASASLTSEGSSGRRTLPSARIRSPTSAIWERGMRGGCLSTNRSLML